MPPAKACAIVTVIEAVSRELFGDPTAALVMDPPGRGPDRHPLPPRPRCARSIPAVKFRIPDLMVMAGRVMELVNSHEPDAVRLERKDDIRRRVLASPNDGRAGTDLCLSSLSQEPGGGRRCEEKLASLKRRTP